MSTLDNVKPGDFVAITSYISRTPSKRQVTRVTATQILVGESLRFMKSTGRVVGAGIVREYAEPWTPEHDQRIVDAERLIQQKATFARMLADFDRAVSDARQLRYRDRLVPEQAVDDFGEVLKRAGAMVAEAARGMV